MMLLACTIGLTDADCRWAGPLRLEFGWYGAGAARTAFAGRKTGGAMALCFGANDAIALGRYGAGAVPGEATFGWQGGRAPPTVWTGR